MIILTATTDKIQAVLGGSVIANQLQCLAFWRDVTTTDFTPGRTLINTNNATDIDLVGSPITSHQIIVDFISIYNNDTSNQTLIVKYDANGTEYILWKGILGTGEKLEYSDKTGFVVIANNGGIKQSQVVGSNNPALNTLNLVVLTTDVANANAVANTIASVTGLSFDVTAGQTYYFEFTINYTAAATTTGSRWSITGPTFTRLDYTSEYTLTATTKTVNNVGAYDLPAASNATSLASGNIVTIWGFITPSANGTVTARFASEVLNSAITAKAGSILRWVRTL
jgi:hypothetical protein